MAPMPSQSFSHPRGPTPPHQAVLSRHQCPSKASLFKRSAPHITMPVAATARLSSQPRQQSPMPTSASITVTPGLTDSQASNKSRPLGHLQQSQPFLHGSQPGTKPARQHMGSNQQPTAIGGFTQSTDHIPGASGSGDQGNCTLGLFRTPSI